MSSSKPRWQKIRRCLLAAPLMAVAALVTISSADAADAADTWYDGATPVFRHIEVSGDVVPTAMLQDRDGLIWIASQMGLASWDGYRFHGYVANPGHPGSLPSSYVNALCEDGAGRLWVATDTGGLARLDKATDTFSVVGAGPRGLSSESVFALAADGKDGLWVGTAAGLDRLDLLTGKVTHQAEGGIPPGLPVHRINALLVDRRGDLWVGTMHGIYLLRSGARAFQPVSALAGTGGAVEVWQLMEDEAGRVWVGTRATGAFVIEPGTTTARQIHESEPSEKKGSESDWVDAMVDAGGGQVWLGTWPRGILQVDTRTWATRRLRHDPAVSGSLGQDGVSVLLRDRSGLVWAGGPNLFDSIDPQQRAISAWYGGGGRLLGGTNAAVTAVLARPDGSVWLGSNNGGVDIVPPHGAHAWQLPAAGDGRSSTTLPKAPVLSMADARDGEVYIGTAKGLYRTREHGRSVERMAFGGLSRTALTRALYMTGNRLWIAENTGLSYVDDPVQGAIAQPVRGLQGIDTMTVSDTGDGSLWVGTSTGLARYWPATGRVEWPWPETPARAGLPRSEVTSVVKDSRGRLWVSLFGGGVRVIEPGAGGAAAHVRSIGHEQGLRNNAANALLLDAQGNAWVSTESGILRIDGDTLATTLLQQSDGVGLLSYWTSAAGAASPDDLLFGGYGLTIVHPDQFRPSRFKAPIVLTDRNGRPASPAGITLGPSQRTLDVTFALLDYRAPKRTRYAYRLAGLESGWTDSPAALRIAHYTNLPPGDYTLQVRASNDPDRWTASVGLPVHVVPTWYETIAFRALVVALLLAFFGMLLQLRTRLLRRRAAALELLVAQRTRELRQRSDELMLRTAELQASEQRLAQLAYFDGLTGLANRRHFNDDLQHMIQLARRGAEFALVLVDLDRFKPINDAYGHDAGDAVLNAVGARLRTATREVDLVSRLGGDEFAVLLNQPGDAETVAAVCDRILAAFAEPILHRGLALEVGASIGVARCPHDACDAMALYKAADVALYAAKEAGRGVWRAAERANALTQDGSSPADSCEATSSSAR